MGCENLSDSGFAEFWTLLTSWSEQHSYGDTLNFWIYRCFMLANAERIIGYRHFVLMDTKQITGQNISVIITLIVTGLVHLYRQKKDKIRNRFSISTSKCVAVEKKPPSFSSFHLISESKVLKLIKDSLAKTCSLDPWLTFLDKR